jgi:hypothetical protein
MSSIKTVFQKEEIGFNVKGISILKLEDVQKFVQERLATGVAHFQFAKADGQLREAYGTTNSQLIERLIGPPKESTRMPDPNYVNYFDLDAMQFRKFSIHEIKTLY